MCVKWHPHGCQDSPISGFNVVADQCKFVTDRVGKSESTVGLGLFMK